MTKVEGSARSAVWRRLAGLLCCTLCIVHGLLAQPGSWQSHFSYQTGRSVAVVSNHVYCATQNGFFHYNKTTRETTVFGKPQGLSDVGISRLLYLADQKRLLIAYQSGDLDLLSVDDTGEPGTVKNISTIVDATSLTKPPTINHLNRVGAVVYLSTDVGIITLDITRDEIRDTYFTEPEVVTYATAVAHDSLYALTSPPNSTSDYNTRYRLRAVSLVPTVNFADPANWRAVPEPDVFMRSLVASQGRLYVTVDKKGIYERQNGKWVLTQPLSTTIVRLFPAPNGLVTATEQAISLPNSTTFTGLLLTDPIEVAADGDRVWVANAQGGLLAGQSGTFERIAPEGPILDQLRTLYAYPQTLIALNESAFNGPQVESYSVPAGRWQHITIPNLTANQSVSFKAAVYLPAEQRLYLGGASGLWSQSEGQPPVPIVLPGAIGSLSGINSLATDLDGNLWIGVAVNNGERASLYVRRADGTFQAFPAANTYGITQVVADDTGFLWFISPSNELIVFDPQTNRRRSFFIAPRTLAKDRTGIIWIGTERGPLVFDSPADAFDPQLNPQPPLQSGRRLLGSENVAVIAVDGGNGKWLGTGSGLYHVSADGSQMLDTFTADNSPLPDNNVQNLAIEPVSGRIFILTGRQDYPDKLVSYGSSATEPAQTLTNLTIFPNPVRPDFTGTVGINGLTDNSTVKILNAGGQLVYETQSQGGTATWNLRDYRGRSAQTGIYLVVVVTADGTEGLAGKLAVVR